MYPLFIFWYQKMKKINIKFIAESAIIAALYAALTWLFAPISYGSIQFRISEILVLLVVFNPKYAIALIIGCFIANTTSSLGWYDLVFGTIATTLAVIPMAFIKKMPLAAIFPVISNAIIVSIELGLAFDMWGGLFFYNVATVGFGELVTLYLLGIPVMYGIAKNEYLVEVMKLDVSHIASYKFITLKNMIIVSLGVLGCILFVAYPFYCENIEEEVVNYSAMSILMNNPFVIIFAIGSICYGLSVLINNRFLKLLCMIISSIAILVTYIFTGIYNNQCFSYSYYYGYILFILLLVISSIIIFIKDNKKIEE